MILPGGHGIWYALARYGMVCGNDYVNFMSWAMVPCTYREADVRLRSCSHVQDPFTSRGTVTCMFHSHVQLLFTLGSDSKLRDCEYIYLFWVRTIDTQCYYVLSVDQVFCESLYLYNITFLKANAIKF